MVAHFAGTMATVHKPSAIVIFSLPEPLSSHLKAHAMVALQIGENSDQERRQS
jgi:hypothetical protein